MSKTNDIVKGFKELREELYTLTGDFGEMSPIILRNTALLHYLHEENRQAFLVVNDVSTPMHETEEDRAIMDAALRKKFIADIDKAANQAYQIEQIFYGLRAVLEEGVT